MLTFIISSGLLAVYLGIFLVGGSFLLTHEYCPVETNEKKN